MKKAFSVLLVFLIFVLCVGCDAEKAPCEQHSYAENWQITREATCFEAGEAKRQCENCDATETKTLDALSHIWGDWTVTTAPSCEGEGVETRTCELCDSNEERSIVSIGHVFGEWTVTREASCSEMGQRVMACEYCDHALTEDIPMIDHTFSDWFVEKSSTCEEAGIDYRFCKICEAKETKETPVQDHDIAGGRCSYCDKYNAPPSEYGEVYSINSNSYINVKSYVVREFDTENLYVISFSAKFPKTLLPKLPPENAGNLKNDPWQDHPSRREVNIGTIGLYGSDGKCYTGDLKTSYCEIRVPKGVEVLAIEYVPVMYRIQSTESGEKYTPIPFLEGKYYWLISEE